MIGAAIALAMVGAPFGCAHPSSSEPFPTEINASGIQNPVLVSATDQEFLWAQISDELDDYFRVRREERVRVVRNTLTEGWIETYPETGSSVLEPWRHDALTSYEKWLGTFQSIRRWARVTVVPMGDEYQIGVQVFKELEDLEQPTGTSAGGQTLRHDDSPEKVKDPTWYEPERYGWIAIGRDVHLEQRILKNIVARLSNP